MGIGPFVRPVAAFQAFAPHGPPPRFMQPPSFLGGHSFLSRRCPRRSGIFMPWEHLSADRIFAALPGFHAPGASAMYLASPAVMLPPALAGCLRSPPCRRLAARSHSMFTASLTVQPLRQPPPSCRLGLSAFTVSLSASGYLPFTASALRPAEVHTSAL